MTPEEIRSLRELAEQGDPWEPCTAAVPRLLDALEQAQAEVTHWKANHDVQVARKRRAQSLLGEARAALAVSSGDPE